MNKMTRLITTFAVVFGLACNAAAAKPSASHRGKVASFSLRWQRVGTSTNFLFATGDYVLWSTSADSGTIELVNDATGSQTNLVPPSGCSIKGFGGGWLLFGCTSLTGAAQPSQLYSLATGTWTASDYSSQMQSFCQESIACVFSPVAVGHDWIAYQVGCRGCVSGYEFQNITTGQWQETSPAPGSAGPTIAHPTLPGLSSRSMLDLSSPTLTRRVCAPLTVPSRGSLFSVPESEGSVSSAIFFFGRYAVVGSPFSTQHLQRCGTRRQIRIPGAASGNPQIVIWNPGTNRLGGILVRSGRNFTVRLPHALPGRFSGFVPSVRHLYALTNPGQIWRAPLPRTH